MVPRLGGRVGLTITFPDGTVARRTAGPTPLSLRRRLVVAPGTSVVTVATTAAPASQAPLVVSAPTLTDQILGPLRTPSAAFGATLPVAGLVGQTCAELYAASPAASLNSGSQRPTDLTVRVLN